MLSSTARLRSAVTMHWLDFESRLWHDGALLQPRGAKRNKFGNVWEFVQLICFLQIRSTKTQTFLNVFLFAPLGYRVGKLDGSQEMEILCLLYDGALAILARALPCSINNISISCGPSRFPTRGQVYKNWSNEQV